MHTSSGLGTHKPSVPAGENSVLDSAANVIDSSPLVV
jgi:hypothetical protein